jgi:hypothetical protein
MIVSTELILLFMSLLGNIFLLLKRINYFSCCAEACILDCRLNDSQTETVISDRSNISVLQKAITKFKSKRDNKIVKSDIPV